MIKIKKKILQSMVLGLFVLLGTLINAPEARTQQGPPSVDADTVDGFHASATPQPDTLLALDSNAKFPNSVLNTGSGGGLDADFLDGLDSTDFALSGHNHDSTYVNEGQTSSITSDMFVDGSVTTSKIGNDQVTSEKIVNVTRIVTANLMGQNSESLTNPSGHGVRMNSSGSSNALYTFAIPYDYAGGDLRVREWFVVHDAGGTAKIFRSTNKMNSDLQIVGVDSGVAHDRSATGGDFARDWIIPDTSVTPGDVFWIVLRRDADLSEDTMGRLDLKAVAVEYSSDQ